MNTLTKKISQMDLSDGPSTVSSQSGSSSKSTFTRVSRTDSSNTGVFTSSVRSNAPVQGVVRTATVPGKIKPSGSNQSLRALASAAAKGVTTSSSSSSASARVASQPLTANKMNQPQPQPMRAPALNNKGSQSSLRSAQYASATERPQQQRSGTNSTVSSISTQSSSDSRSAAPKTAVQAATTLDLGKYDGGFEFENDKRGSAVFGEAAELLALDSSISAYVASLFAN